MKELNSTPLYLCLYLQPDHEPNGDSNVLSALVLFNLDFLILIYLFFAVSYGFVHVCSAVTSVEITLELCIQSSKYMN